jgi:hypothetical protein
MKKSVTNRVTEVRAFRLQNLNFFYAPNPTSTINYTINMPFPSTPPMLPRLLGEEIKTKHKEAIRQLYKICQNRVAAA